VDREQADCCSLLLSVLPVIPSPWFGDATGRDYLLAPSCLSPHHYPFTFQAGSNPIRRAYLPLLSRAAYPAGVAAGALGHAKTAPRCRHTPPHSSPFPIPVAMCCWTVTGRGGPRRVTLIHILLRQPDLPASSTPVLLSLLVHAM